MRYAILSDVHTNLPALEAVLDDVEPREGVDAVYHLGDLVGYAPWPNEVVEFLRRRAIPGVAGNYDSTTATRYEHCGCRYEDPEQEALSHESYAWTLEAVSAETRRRLAALPFRIDLRPAGGHASGPKDGDPRAGYVLLDAPGDGAGRGGTGWRVEHVRVEYDVKRAARAIEESELPAAFAEHLGAGGPRISA